MLANKFFNLFLLISLIGNNKRLTYKIMSSNFVIPGQNVIKLFTAKIK